MAAVSSQSGRMPRRPVRTLFMLLPGLISLIVLLLWLLPYVASLDSVKAQVVTQLETALQRPVEVGAVRLQILSGLGAGLEDLTIFNPPGWQQPYVIKVGTLSVKLAWQPFLQRRLEITRIVLSHGDIVIERDAQGRLNVADLLESRSDAATDSSSPPSSAPRPQATQPGESALSRLMVSDVALRQMQVIFVDHMAVPGKTVTTSVRDVQLDVSDMALGARIPFDMSATLLTDGNHNIRLRGQVGPLPAALATANVPVDLHLHATDVLLAQLIPYLGRAFPFTQGRVGADAKIRGDLAGSLHVSGDLSLTEAMLPEARGGELPKPLPTLTSTYEISVDLAQELLHLTRVQVVLSKLEATVQGSIAGLKTNPQADLSLQTNDFAPGELLTAVPMLASWLSRPADVQGTAQLQARLKGTPQHLRSEARVDLRDLLLKSGSFGGGAQDVGGLHLETDHTQAMLIMALMESHPPSVQMDIRAQRLVFDQQAARPPAQTPKPDPTHSPPTPAPPTKTSPLPVHLSGKVSIAEGRITPLTFQQMTADVSLLEGVLKSTQHMQLYAGSYQGHMQVDLTQRQPTFTLDGRLRNLDVGQALHEFTPARNVLLGVLDSDLHLIGRGSTWELISKTLSGHGHVHIREAQLTTFDLIPKLLHVLRTFGEVAGWTIPDELVHESLRVVEGDWRLHEGKVLTDDLRLRGQGVEALLKGYIGLDQAVAYEGKVLLPSGLVRVRGPALKWLQDDKGRFVLPFTVQGTVTAPRIAFNAKDFTGLAREALTDKLRRQIGEKLGDMLEQPPEGAQQGQEPSEGSSGSGTQPQRPKSPRRILEDLLRR